jgi:hypothetical protein
MTDNIVVLQALVRDLDKLLRDSWKERDALKAEITAMKQQEPAGGVVHNGESAALYDIREQGALLYTLPGAEHAPSEEARLVSYCPDGNTCTLNINGVEMYYDRIDMDATPAPDAIPDSERAPFTFGGNEMSIKRQALSSSDSTTTKTGGGVMPGLMGKNLRLMVV